MRPHLAASSALRQWGLTHPASSRESQGRARGELHDADTGGISGLTCPPLGALALLLIVGCARDADDEDREFGWSPVTPYSDGRPSGLVSLLPKPMIVPPRPFPVLLLVCLLPYWMQTDRPLGRDPRPILILYTYRLCL
ncbi:MAG: hypothetical protein KDA29_09645 [Phycisphaerales bacterium]|nr:hypothetical protein [Phycisphaerales bacterium]